jgi:hypothetical protein
MKFLSDISKALAEMTKKILWTLGLYAFLLILFLVFVDFILGGFIFYKYVFFAEKKEPKISGSILKFDDNAYQKVIGELQRREQGSSEFPTYIRLK